MRATAFLLSLCLAGLPALRPASAWAQRVRVQTRAGAAASARAFPGRPRAGLERGAATLSLSLPRSRKMVLSPRATIPAVQAPILAISLLAAPAFALRETSKIRMPAEQARHKVQETLLSSLSESFPEAKTGARRRGKSRDEAIIGTGSPSRLAWMFDKQRRGESNPVPPVRGRAAKDESSPRGGWRLAAFSRPSDDQVDAALAALDGRLDAADFRPSRPVAVKRSALLTLHFTLLGAALAAASIGAGPIPVLLAVSFVGTHHFWKYLSEKRGAGAGGFNTGLFGSEARDYKRYQERLLGALVSRLGRDPARGPRVRIDNSRGVLGAAGEGRGISPESTVAIGEGYRFKPVTHTLFVLAHEIGHLVLGDNNLLSELRLRPGYKAGLRIALRLAFYTAMFSMGAALMGTTAMLAWGGGSLLITALLLAAGHVMGFSYRNAKRALLSFRVLKFVVAVLRMLLRSTALLGPAGLSGYLLLSGGLPTGPLIALGLTIAGAAALAWAGLLAGLGVTRQEELRADDFAAWLTRPGWAAAHFSAQDAASFKLKEKLGRMSWRQRLRLRLLSTHPSDADRAERMKVN